MSYGARRGSFTARMMSRHRVHERDGGHTNRPNCGRARASMSFALLTNVLAMTPRQCIAPRDATTTATAADAGFLIIVTSAIGLAFSYFLMKKVSAVKLQIEGSGREVSGLMMERGGEDKVRSARVCVSR